MNFELEIQVDIYCNSIFFNTLIFAYWKMWLDSNQHVLLGTTATSCPFILFDNYLQ